MKTHCFCGVKLKKTQKKYCSKKCCGVGYTTITNNAKKLRGILKPKSVTYPQIDFRSTERKIWELYYNRKRMTLGDDEKVLCDYAEYLLTFTKYEPVYNRTLLDNKLIY